jgi:hypothetical protein
MKKADFDKIPMIDKQTQYTEWELDEIGKIFRLNKVTDVFGVGLLHRHYDMPKDNVALITAMGSKVSVCKATELAGDVNNDTIRGEMFLFNDSKKFQAYEYQRGAHYDFPHKFLNDLKVLFAEHDHIRKKFVLIASLPSHGGRNVEFHAADTLATITLKSDLWEGDAAPKVLTAWKYRSVQPAEDGTYSAGHDHNNSYSASSHAELAPASQTESYPPKTRTS